MMYVRLMAFAVLGSFAFGPAGLAQGGAREEIAALGCAACHADLQTAGLRPAPDLRRTVPLIDPGFLEAFIASPHAAQPGTRMPELLGAMPPEERALAAAELSAFLRTETNAEGMEASADADASAERGQRLFHEVGCVMCHGPMAATDGASRVPVGPEGARSLEHVADKYGTNALATFLLDPLRHRPSGLMPDMQLSRGEAADLAVYLSPAAPKDAEAVPESALAAAGRERFRVLQCGSCHAGFDAAGETFAAPAARDVFAGCLADEPGPGVPQYALTDEERSAFREVLPTLGTPLTSAEHIASTLGALRCTSCHVREDAGGVPQRLDAYLVTDEPDLGDHARRPPNLTGVGAKLRPAWMERVLLDGASVRPYMHTRMPVFGADNVGHLPALFAEVDGEASLELPAETGENEREARDAAHKMLGVTGLGCVTCHTFNGKPAPSFQGLDLLTAPERLQERWFRDLLVSPQKKLPGIVMPESWPGGVAALDDVLEGSTDRQIAAIWHYLRLGTSARDPRGIYQPQWNLDVEDRPVVYRGRSRVAGFRGIAVGFPAGIHYAFDAQNGSLAAIWRGDFVSVNWNGQGAGDFYPRTEATALPRDVAWLEQITDDTPWPLRPITTEEEPINADPTYPRQHGYRFHGYRLDAYGVPTIRYEVNGVAIEDRITPIELDGRYLLRRQISLGTDAATSLTLRLLSGPIEPLGGGRYRSGGVIVGTPEGSARSRPIAGSSEGEQELLIDLRMPAGRTSLEISYDLGN
ncbi:Cytochrome c [Planctomycetes bacterium Poly30]|uniref:Cytochrome c n=1 Tax=Saltatorellus ferox TaxID=2528018 RepID=A0A518ESZ8_9BACT|nr:Cytochrome c [Planctomycetes bacterium Poly30]